MRSAPALPRLRPDTKTVMGGAVACRQLPCVLDQREIAHPKHAIKVISLTSSHMSSFVHCSWSSTRSQAARRRRCRR